MMLSVDLTAALAAEHSRDLARAAEASRLVALARCCRPSSWKHAAARLGQTRAVALAAVRRGLSRPRPGAACCAGA